MIYQEFLWSLSDPDHLGCILFHPCKTTNPFDPSSQSLTLATLLNVGPMGTCWRLRRNLVECCWRPLGFGKLHSEAFDPKGNWSFVLDLYSIYKLFAHKCSNWLVDNLDLGWTWARLEGDVSRWAVPSQLVVSSLRQTRHLETNQ